MKKSINLLFIGILLIFSCGKQSNDIRDNYRGNWGFKICSYKSDLLLGNYGYDTVYYIGGIENGAGDKELLIQYLEDKNITVTLDSDTHFHNMQSMNCPENGEFEGSNKIHIGISCGDLSSKTVRDIIGEKITNSIKKSPIASTQPVKVATTTGAFLCATVNANYINTNVSFEYGTSTNYGNSFSTDSLAAIQEDIKVRVYLSGLIPNTLYHYRVKASNLKGVTYGSDMTFTTLTPVNPITDVDGNVYHTLSIGDQVWLVENLKTTKYSNGDPIGTTSPASLNITSETNPKYQWAYNGDESIVSDYGRLYTYYAAMDSRNVCPSGWHVSTDEEWHTLLTFLDHDAVKLLKEAGTTHWGSPNNADNSLGFTALPGGNRIENYFGEVGFKGNWWITTAGNPTAGFLGQAKYLIESFNYFFQRSYRSDTGLSIRCLKN